jgi:alpha-methylacyl-CoA racemase
MDRGRWGELKAKLTEVFLSKTQAQWCEIMEGSDVCFAPVLNLIDAAEHPHNKARDSYQTVAGMLQQSPAPRFSRTQAAAITAPRVPGEDTAAVLADFGLSAEEIDRLTEQGVVAG